MLIFHMCRRDEWDAALRAGRYEGSSQDKADGFIHFSTVETIVDSAARHRAGQSGLVLIAADPERLGALVKWEEARGGKLFPHLYGALETAHVTWVKDLPLGADGNHLFPPLD